MTMMREYFFEKVVEYLCKMQKKTMKNYFKGLEETLVFLDTARIRTLCYKFVWGTHKSMTYSHKVMMFNTHTTLLLPRKFKIVSYNTLLRYKTISITPPLFSLKGVSCSYAILVWSKASFEPSCSLLLVLFHLFLAKTYWLRYDLFKYCNVN